MTQDASWLLVRANAGAGRLDVGVSHDGTVVLDHQRTPPDGQGLYWTHATGAGTWDVAWTMAASSLMLAKPYIHLFWADMPSPRT